MKILIDLTSLHHNLSGIERHAMCMALALLKYDNSSSFYLVFKNDVHNSFSTIINNERIKSIIVKGKNKFVFNQVILPFVLYKYKSDAYLFFAFQCPYLFRRKNIFNTVHDLVCWDYANTMKFFSSIYYKLSIKNALRVSKRIFVISNYTKNRVVELFKYSKDQLLLTYCGVSNSFFQFHYNEIKAKEIKQKYNLPDDYLLCLSTVEPRKNIKLLINAYIELYNEKKINYYLVLAGRIGWKVKDIKQYIPLQLVDKIIFTGFIEDEDLPYIYYLSKCFVFPSIYEGFGLPPLEAMSIGTPVISSDSTALTEILGNASIKFKSNDKEDLKNKILLFSNLDNKEKSKIINGGYERAKLFKWDISAKKVFNVIKKNCY